MRPIIAWPRLRPKKVRRAAVAAGLAVVVGQAKAVAVQGGDPVAGSVVGRAVDRVDRNGKTTGPIAQPGQGW